MLPKCCVCHIKKNRAADKRGIFFFPVPTEKNLRQQWVLSIQALILKPWFSLSQNDLVCSKHFFSKHISRQGRRVQLEPGSLPMKAEISTLKDGVCNTLPVFEAVRVDGHTILSFVSMEDLQGYVVNSMNNSSFESLNEDCTDFPLDNLSTSVKMNKLITEEYAIFAASAVITFTDLPSLIPLPSKEAYPIMHQSEDDSTDEGPPDIFDKAESTNSNLRESSINQTSEIIANFEAININYQVQEQSLEDSKDKNPQEKQKIDYTPDAESVKKTMPSSKLQEIAQDPEFEELVAQERSRCNDQNIDLTIIPKQTFQLVTWPRFYRLFHAGKIHVRFINRKNVPAVILVMPPVRIVASNISCCIKDLSAEAHVPHVVKRLLHPSAPESDASLFATLFCDGKKWELIGLIKHTTHPSNKEASPISSSSPEEANSDSNRKDSNSSHNSLPSAPSVDDVDHLPEPTCVQSQLNSTVEIITEISPPEKPAMTEVLSQFGTERNESPVVKTPVLEETSKAVALSSATIEENTSSPALECPGPNAMPCVWESREVTKEINKSETDEEELNNSDDFYVFDESEVVDETLKDADGIKVEIKNHSFFQPKDNDCDVQEIFEDLDGAALEKRQKQIEERLAKLASTLQFPQDIMTKSSGKRSLTSIAVESSECSQPHSKVAKLDFEQDTSLLSSSAKPADDPVVSGNATTSLRSPPLTEPSWNKDLTTLIVNNVSQTGYSENAPKSFSAQPIRLLSTYSGPITCLNLEHTNQLRLQEKNNFLINKSQQKSLLRKASGLTCPKPETSVTSVTINSIDQNVKWQNSSKTLCSTPQPRFSYKVPEISKAIAIESSPISRPTSLKEVSFINLTPAPLNKQSETSGSLKTLQKGPIASINLQQTNQTRLESNNSLAVRELHQKSQPREVSGFPCLALKATVPPVTVTSVDQRTSWQNSLKTPGPSVQPRSKCQAPEVSKQINTESLRVSRLTSIKDVSFANHTTAALRKQSDSSCSLETSVKGTSSKVHNSNIAEVRNTVTPHKSTIVAVQQKPLTWLSCATELNATMHVVFPKISTISTAFEKRKATPSTVELCFQIEFEALTGEHRALCPLSTSVTLPLQNRNDSWCMVSVASVPKAGLSIPGANIVIAHNALEKVLSRATERRGLLVPILFQNPPSNGFYKEGFGIYAISQLPRHIFIGPFTCKYLGNIAFLPLYMKMIGPALDTIQLSDEHQHVNFGQSKTKLKPFNVGSRSGS